MKKQITAAVMMLSMIAPAMANGLDNQAFEKYVFHTQADAPMQLAELSQKEMKETEGEWIPNAVGGIMGGVGGHFSYMASAIASGSYNREAHWTAIGGGALIGAMNPINGGRALINGMRGVAVGAVAGGINGYAGSTGKNTDIRR
ncbi:TPA: hypothetical protein WI034_000764 [Neisseria meningitidis]|uniref:Integral membrane protein n=3 Tax=Neisseria meningitidis TaxID=487 RepID=I4E6J0_NEIME|nr:hypothetical protein [Neisseria meningitidis]EOC12837.1 putative integral membrane protein [Neisseria meningitidis 73696]CCA44958.1 hypothetical protein NMALPHA522_1417 [Neisseria meningitidis alpha522]EGC56651.1 putative integral membrane protein [Neisseria meningitidis M13399]EJU71023.1 putative integral membrane protein [Neisseria meningitidis 80179]MBG8579023.1 hypothetical protein [Neisseria meningitidis]